MKALLLIAVSALFLAFSVAEARLVTYTGTCAEGGGEWIIVVTIDDSTGRVTRLEGENCSGEHWVGHCGRPAEGTSHARNSAIGGRMLFPADCPGSPAPGEKDNL